MGRRGCVQVNGTVTLRPPTLAECQLVREWRNDPAVLPMLRTGYKTEADQAAFYRDVVCNPEADHRYYALEDLRGFIAGGFLGLGGLTYLSRVPGEAEISLILGPQARGQGYSVEAVAALLSEAELLGLRAVTGECLKGGPKMFWASMYFGLEWPGWTRGKACNHDGGSFVWRWERTA
jgi:RimJ/RimL family protein N-acetyltransferase